MSTSAVSCGDSNAINADDLGGLRELWELTSDSEMKLAMVAELPGQSDHSSRKWRARNEANYGFQEKSLMC